MTDDPILSRSAAAWAAGRRGDALRLLKDAVRADRTRADARLALAERYREMGNPDQAGRWGIAFEGWTTDLERDRLARLLASSWVRDQDVTEFLALPPGELPAPVVGLLVGPVARYRERFDLEARERIESLLPTGSSAVEWLWFLFIAALVAIPLLVTALAFFGAAGVGVIRWLVFALFTLLAAALVVTAVTSFRRRESASIWWAVAGLVVIGLLVTYHLVAQAQTTEPQPGAGYDPLLAAVLIG
ncbi:tetratricopeptide repeat protein [Microbacteriaceae bacterium 4G12]